MNTFRTSWLAACLLALGTLAAAHGSKIGDIAIGHPYAAPSLPGMTTGAAYFAMLENKGAAADTLVRASTPAASRVEIHTMSVDAQGVMRMREIEGIELAPKAVIRMRPGLGFHLMLIGLKEPLKDGASFPMTLEFAHAGKVEVSVTVQPARSGDAASAMHMH